MLLYNCHLKIINPILPILFFFMLVLFKREHLSQQEFGISNFKIQIRIYYQIQMLYQQYFYNRLKLLRNTFVLKIINVYQCFALPAFNYCQPLNIISLYFYLPKRYYIVKKKKMTKYQKMKEYAFLRGSQSKILEQLRCTKNINFIDFVDEKNNTPLHYATSLNYLHAINQYVQLLKNKQLWVDKLNQKITNQVIRYKTKVWLNAENNEGLTAMHYASLKGYTKIADTLENAGARVDKVTNHGFNIFHLAAQEGKLNSLIHFRGKLDLSASDNNGSTALHWAVYKGHEKITKYLVSQDQTQLNFQDKQGRTPLHIAIVYQHYKIAQILLLAGASRNIKDKNNQTAISLAEQKGHQKLLRLISLKQPCRYKAEYVYSKKQRQNWKWIAIMLGFLIGLVVANFFVGKTPLIYNQENGFSNPLGEADRKLAYSYSYFGVELALTIICLILSLKIHFNKNTIKRYSLAYLQQNIGLSDGYCFQCQVIVEPGTRHCYYCNQCSPIQIKHSHVLGRCINDQNKYFYLVLLILISLVLMSQLYRGFFLLNYIINEKDSNIDSKVIKYVLIGIDLVCFVPLTIIIYYLVKTAKAMCKVKKLTEIKKLSESTFDSRSTLIAQKIKQYHQKSNFNINNSKQILHQNISERYNNA